MALLKPFLVTTAHSGKDDLGDLEPAVREVFTNSGLSKDPKRLNVFIFVLDSKGQVVHEFHGSGSIAAVPSDRLMPTPQRREA